MKFLKNPLPNKKPGEGGEIVKIATSTNIQVMTNLLVTDRAGL
jgi:hypothetical protein